MAVLALQCKIGVVTSPYNEIPKDNKTHHGPRLADNQARGNRERARINANEKY
jgi:hypothetical protein